MSGKYNLPLLRKEREWVVEQIEHYDDRSELDMMSWRSTWYDDEENLCHTTYCIAGHVAAMTPGVKWLNNELVKVGRRSMSVAIFARGELGLSAAETDRLFFCDVGDVLKVLDEIIATAEEAERA